MRDSSRVVCLVGHEYGFYKGHGGIATYLLYLADAFQSETDFKVVVIFQHGVAPRNSERFTSYKISAKATTFEAAVEVEKILRIERPDFIEVTDYLGLCSQLCLSRALNKLDFNPVIVTNHHTSTKEIWEWGTRLKFAPTADDGIKQLAISEKTQFFFSDKNLSTSRFLASYVATSYKIPNTECIPAYYKLPEVLVAPTPRRSGRRLNILSIGRFELRKCQDILIEAVQNLADEGFDFHLTLVGNSVQHFLTGEDFRQLCYSKVRKDLRDRFSFYDFLSPTSASKLYAENDIFVIPSTYENFPNTAMDALSYGLPIVGSKTSGIVDMIGPKCSGMTFEPMQSEDLSRVLREFAALSVEQRQELYTIQFDNLKNLVGIRSSFLPRLNLFEELKKNQSNIKQKFTNIKKFLVVNNRIDAGVSDRQYDDFAFESSAMVPQDWKGQSLSIFYVPNGVGALNLFSNVQEMDLANIPEGAILGFSGRANELLDIYDIAEKGSTWPILMNISVSSNVVGSISSLISAVMSKASGINYLYDSKAKKSAVSRQVRYGLQRQYSSVGLQK